MPSSSRADKVTESQGRLPTEEEQSGSVILLVCVPASEILVLGVSNCRGFAFVCFVFVCFRCCLIGFVCLSQSFFNQSFLDSTGMARSGWVDAFGGSTLLLVFPKGGFNLAGIRESSFRMFSFLFDLECTPKVHRLSDNICVV